MHKRDTQRGVCGYIRLTTMLMFIKGITVLSFCSIAVTKASQCHCGHMAVPSDRSSRRKVSVFPAAVKQSGVK